MYNISRNEKYIHTAAAAAAATAVDPSVSLPVPSERRAGSASACHQHRAPCRPTPALAGSGAETDTGHRSMRGGGDLSPPYLHHGTTPQHRGAEARCCCWWFSQLLLTFRTVNTMQPQILPGPTGQPLNSIRPTVRTATPKTDPVHVTQSLHAVRSTRCKL